MDISFCSPKDHPSLRRLATCQLELWPEHERFLRMRFALGDLAAAERVAALVLRLADGDEARLCADYRWMCDRVLEEELFFRREGTYRLSTFADAEREVYGNYEYMTRYMNGLLLSQVWWSNHTGVISYYADEFLPNQRPGYRHLEIGPGHGLLLYFAAQDRSCADVCGWDLSAASLDATKHALQKLGAGREATLSRQNIFDTTTELAAFDTVVISEVCEHLEDPRAALTNLSRFLALDGQIFVNMPINSPAPDHLFLLRTPEEVVELVRSAGYEIVTTRFFPCSGYSEQRARKAKATMSCVVVGKRPSEDGSIA